MLVDGMVQKAKEHVTQLFEQLPPEMYFHNLQHSYFVFDAATTIALGEGLALADLTVVQLAALFHDTGYLYYYEG